MNTDVDEATLVACARAAHEANRAYCLFLGDVSQPSWDDAAEWVVASAKNGVRGALAGNTPEQSHAGWLAQKHGEGWVYGPVKDIGRKEHPCCVPYTELSSAQRAKDTLFISVVRAVARAIQDAMADRAPKSL